MKSLFFLLSLFPVFGYAQPTVAVIGGGPSGLSAATTCQDLGYQVLLLEQKPPSPDQGALVSFWPGSPSSKWDAILKTMREAFTKAGGTILEKEVEGIKYLGDTFTVSTRKESYAVKAVVIATGRHPKTPSFLTKGSDRILTNPWNRQPFSPKDSVIIIGQGEPLYFVYLRAASAAGKISVFSYQTNRISLDPISSLFPSTTILQASSITDIGSTKDKAFVNYLQQGSKLQKEASYIIVAEEKEPSSYLVKDLCALDSSGAIVTARDTGETSLPGLFACGEVAEIKPLTAVQATAEGQKVGLAVAYFLVDKKIPPKRTLSVTPIPTLKETPPETAEK